MIVPVRCFSCGKVLGEYYDEYRKGVKDGKKAGEVLDSLKVERYCCRRTLFTHVDLLQEIMKYNI